TRQGAGGIDRNDILSQPNAGIGDRDHSCGYPRAVQSLYILGGRPTGPSLLLKHILGGEEGLPLRRPEMMVKVDLLAGTVSQILRYQPMCGNEQSRRKRGSPRDELSPWKPRVPGRGICQRIEPHVVHNRFR